MKKTEVSERQLVYVAADRGDHDLGRDGRAPVPLQGHRLAGAAVLASAPKPPREDLQTAVGSKPVYYR